MIDKPFGTSPLPRSASLLYGAAVWARNALYASIPSMSWKTPVPVVGIGGIRAGGTGKTPAAILVAGILKRCGARVGIVSRGYRRQSREIVIVGPDQTADWTLTGDEPAMMHARLPGIWLGIHPVRRWAIEKLVCRTDGPQVIVLDDAFQHRAVGRDLDIVCLPADPFSDRLIPCGYLREPLTSLARAQVALLIGGTNELGTLEKSSERLRCEFGSLSVYPMVQRAGLWTNLATGESASRPLVSSPLAVAGIARPERFLQILEAQKIKVRDTCFFEDHHIYSPRDACFCGPESTQGIVTTEKDAIKLKRLNMDGAQRVWYLNIDIDFVHRDHESSFIYSLQKISSSVKETRS